MNVLVLEDESYRQKWFRQFLIGNNVDIVKSVANAKQLLVSRTYDRIYLDHDLLPEHYGNERVKDNESGFAIAQMLSRRTELSPKAEIIIHSLSESGADRMWQVLADAGRTVTKRKFFTLKR